MTRKVGKGHGWPTGGQVRHRRNWLPAALGRWLIGIHPSSTSWLHSIHSRLPYSTTLTTTATARHTPIHIMHALEAQDALHAPATPGGPETDVHHYAKGKAGYCAMRSNCGRATMFGAELPCPDDGKADEVSTPCVDAKCSGDDCRVPRRKYSAAAGCRSWPSGGESPDNPNPSHRGRSTDPRSPPTSRSC